MYLDLLEKCYLIYHDPPQDPWRLLERGGKRDALDDENKKPLDFADTPEMQKLLSSYKERKREKGP